VVTTAAVLGTGIAAVVENHNAHWLVQAHKASFIVWFAAMTVHVVGHAVETPGLAFADWRRSRRNEAPRASTRLTALALTSLTSIALAFASLDWARH